ncbi:WD repeat-containing protein 17-like isoform X2 [Ostrea edulis]|uniref:WD repeat-containing protein 17-like isoform X2 n=1 Tax=Ostrea edulis TaxID=37623 RepID=UPI0024AFE1C9|nr:WD repeat-containing protein 17-like isoform X2 [Ostrea edulis]XP_056009978.1 WD repeat-containing protein 17-like isoform X2 [Ostrea edulis]
MAAVTSYQLLCYHKLKLDRKFSEFRLISIMSEHTKTINCIKFHPTNPDLIVTTGSDKQVIVWNIAKQQVISKLEVVTREAPKAVGWTTVKYTDAVCFIQGTGPLNVWTYQNGQKLQTFKEASGFSSHICQFRWHPKNPNRIAFGHMDGSISICNIGGKSRKEICRPESMEEDDDDPVTALEWDPLSADYLIMTNTFHPVRLIDIESGTVITEFKLPSAAANVHTLAWISGAPGMFVTGDVKSGILRIWNVSKPTPIENIRIKKTGIHALQTISIERQLKKKDARDRQVSSTSPALAPASTTSSHFALPPAKVVCTFLDGGIGLYDLGGRKWDFLREQGHIETIFDCKFCPYNRDILATGSFDGTIKLWDINSMTPIDSSPGNEGVVYALSWAPGDLNCILASTSKQGMFIWDIGKGRIIERFRDTNKSAVFCVAWNQKDSKRIMSAGADGYCIIRLVNGEIVQKYRHPGAVYGCDWSPDNKDMLATACEDKLVRIYYLATVADQPLKIFSGHTAKVFHIKWSPLKEGMLASGSDDCTIHVWDYSQESCYQVLRGHEGPVRGIMWNWEIPYLLVSGSWDYKIRIWDIRDGACVETLLDHGADVYGLTSHPERPFLMASSSRDSTVRMWSLNSLVQPIELNVLAGKPWTSVLGSTDSAMAIGNPPLLCGKGSKDLKAEMEAGLPSNNRDKLIKMCSKFFSPPTGADNLWELVSVVKGLDDSLLSQKYKRGIMHVKHLSKFKTSEAQEQEMVKMSSFGGGIGSLSREGRLREAAKIYIQLGNLQRYCELMVELGEWERAIAVAPGVSMDYWKSLTKRYAQYLSKEDDESLIPFCTAVGDPETLIEFSCSRGQLSHAVLTAQVACEGVFDEMSQTYASKGLCNGVEPNKSYQKSLTNTVQKLADWYFYNGSPVLAACCHLSVDDCQQAVQRLIQGHELELAASVGVVLGNVPEQTFQALEYLSRRCEHLGKWDLAVDLLKLIPDNRDLMIRCCAKCAASSDEINYLHRKADLPPLDKCLHEAETLKNQIKPVDCVRYYVVSSSPEVGLDIGLEYIKASMSKNRWSVDDIFPILQFMGSIRADKLQQHKLDRQRMELMCLCAYVGALRAIRLGYDEIVRPLFKHARDIISKAGLCLPVTDEVINKEMLAWDTICMARTNCYPGPLELSRVTASPDVMQRYEELIRKAGGDNHPDRVGQDCASNSHLPSHSDVHVSCVSQQRVQGLAYFLEDGKSAISPNEALMWAKVNPFSPLASGLRINPF